MSLSVENLAGGIGLPDVARLALEGDPQSPITPSDWNLLCRSLEAGPALVDLSGITVTDQRSVARLVHALAAVRGPDAAPWCVVTGRLTLALVLERTGLGALATIFVSTEEALRFRPGPGTSSTEWGDDHHRPGIRRPPEASLREENDLPTTPKEVADREPAHLPPQ